MSSLNNSPCLRSVNQSQGCPVPVGNSVCGEANSLEIMKEFNRLYEERMQQVDCEAGGDCLQEKIKLQREWIRNLTQQNEMLVRAVQELEYEATERVQQLEEKLHKSAQCLCEGEKLLNEKERTVQELTQKVNYYSSFGDVESMAKELRLRQVECDSLKQEMADMGQALTEEVALKHDHIIMLRKDVKNLEDRCLQADKQTAFKEDIIRELRKEIKQLKQQVSLPEKPLKLSKTNPIQKEAQTSQPKILKEQSRVAVEHPYLVIHTTKKQTGKNTVICITKDGSVHQGVNYTNLVNKNMLEKNSINHMDVCLKCKNKISIKKSFFPACKSENDLISVKNMLKPVKERSKLTSTTFSRCKTFVDRTKRVLNEIDCQERCRGVSNYLPVKMQVDYLEKRKY